MRSRLVVLCAFRQRLAGASSSRLAGWWGRRRGNRRAEIGSKTLRMTPRRDGRAILRSLQLASIAPSGKFVLVTLRGAALRQQPLSRQRHR